MRWLVRGLILLVVVGGALFWWLLLSGAKAPATATGVLDIAQIRALADAPADQRPTRLRVLEIGHDRAPNFAVQAGRLSGDSAMSYNAVEITLPDQLIMVGGAVDQSTAAGMALTDGAVFDPVAYESLLDALVRADRVLITHEHLDHVMGIARHPVPLQLTNSLWLNGPQLAALPQFQNEAQQAEWAALEIPVRLLGTVEVIAPGVVVIPAGGHTAGSQMIFISMASGEEILLIGDIAWNMSNITDLTTRPVLTQYVAFDPNEVREHVKAQLRALHDLSIAEPDIAIVPSHDRTHLQALDAGGVLDFLPAE